MKKQVFLRGLLGVPIGITIGYLITVIISLCVADGKFHPCVPEFVNQFGSEINAVALQLAMSALIGVAFGSSSVIWEMDNWSIAKQTGIYFTITALTMLPIAYFARWMEHSIGGFLLFFGIFVAIFLVMWFSQCYIWKFKVKKINEKVKKVK